VVARRLEDEVVGRGWPVGEVLGSETELLDRFGVSRAVLREAVRIVEHTGAARMRRGPGGGLVVSEPNRGAVVAAMGVWFSYVGVTSREMLEARTPLLLGATRLAAERINSAGKDLLLARLAVAEGARGVSTEAVISIEAAIATVADNPILALFIDSLGDVSVSRLNIGRARMEPPVTDEEFGLYIAGYRRVVEAIAEGDPDAAVRRITRLIDVLDGRLADQPQRRTRRPTALPSGGKLAERVASALRADIERARWPVGEVLGSETDLIERYKVSRAILREAVRILEHHGAVQTKRGPHGGLIVTAPDSAALLRSTQLVLEYEGVQPDRLQEARMIVEGCAVRLAAQRMTPEHNGQLQAAIDAEKLNPSVPHLALHRIVAAATDNRLVELFVRVMADLVPRRLLPRDRTGEQLAAVSTEAHNAHRRVVEAIVAGDTQLAERRMLSHLRAGMQVLE
jgi:DNA-binding FadR family transcriptional regulator